MITCIIGTRAQLIKMAPVIRVIEDRHWPFCLTLTGQHHESMDELRRNFGIRTTPRYLYQGPEISGIVQMLAWAWRCWRVFRRSPDQFLPVSAAQPNLVLIHGDTFSTLLGLVFARVRRVRVAHVECGLRSFRLFHPFPEELTRILVMRFAHIGFCPGSWALSNAQRHPHLECINTHQNTLLDALNTALSRAPTSGNPSSTHRYGVCSIHRFENVFFKRRLKAIVELVSEIAKTCPVKFVLHPVTRKRLIRSGLMNALRDHPGITLLDRMGYFNFIALLKDSAFVITDGGGNQEELSYLGIPTLLMRKATERQDGVGTTVTLSHYNRDVALAFVHRLRAESAMTKPANIRNSSPTGIIIQYLESFIQTRPQPRQET
jgi:UDP-N-acetylglucosamine 2-epimerase (non-hydrolysing)